MRNSTILKKIAGATQHWMQAAPSVMLVWLLTTLLLTGCNEVGATYQDIDVEGWDYGHTIEFAAQPIERHQLHVRCTHTYPYQNLVVEIRQDTLYCDTLQLDITASPGAPLTEVSAPLPRPTSGPLCIRHIMSVESLPGVTNIGLE